MLFFLFLIVHQFTFLFLYFPFILLRFLLRFQCFLQLCGLFLSICYTFCYIPGSCFADFTCFFNFTCVSLHFAMMSCILKPFPFNWLYVGLISLYFVQGLSRFNDLSRFNVILRHFGFTLLVCCSVRDDKQGGITDSQISALHFAQLFPQWFTMFISFLNMSIAFLKIDLK